MYYSCVLCDDFCNRVLVVPEWPSLAEIDNVPIAVTVFETEDAVLVATIADDGSVRIFQHELLSS